ncbi:MAG: RDD family protein [Chloroflexota bacterium]
MPGAPGLVFASTGTRFTAYLVDLVVFAVISVIVSGIVIGILGRSASTATPSGVIRPTALANTIGGIAGVVISFVYFVGSWTAGRRATPGQRVFKLQVGNAFDGRGLTLEQAIRRWLALGYAFTILSLVPSLSGLATLLEVVWVLALIVTIATSQTKQGLHDRFANTAVVQPAGAGASGAATVCLVIAIIIAVLVILTLVALIFVGGQVSEILSAAGESI